MFAGRLEDLGQCSAGVERAVQGRIENRTVVDRDDGVAAGRGKPDAPFAIAAATGVDGDAPPAGAVRIDEKVDLAFDAGMCQRIDHDLAFPGAIGLRLPMLDGAAAASAKVSAERRNPLRAGAIDAQQAPAIRVAGHRRDFDGFAIQRVRHEYALAVSQGDAVAAMADMIDDQMPRAGTSHDARR